LLWPPGLVDVIEPLALTVAHRRTKPVVYAGSHFTGSITLLWIWRSPTAPFGIRNAA
jgi:hypothetical protein